MLDSPPTASVAAVAPLILQTSVHIGGKLMPLATLHEHLDELDRRSHIIAHCRSGHRSAKAVALLRESGFEDAWSLNGGLMNWIDRIDPSLPRY